LLAEDGDRLTAAARQSWEESCKRAQRKRSDFELTVGLLD
jgi:hypothetical protein